MRSSGLHAVWSTHRHLYPCKPQKAFRVDACHCSYAMLQNEHVCGTQSYLCLCEYARSGFANFSASPAMLLLTCLPSLVGFSAVLCLKFLCSNNRQPFSAVKKYADSTFLIATSKVFYSCREQGEGAQQNELEIQVRELSHRQINQCKVISASVVERCWKTSVAKVGQENVEKIKY